MKAEAKKGGAGKIGNLAGCMKKFYIKRILPVTSINLQDRCVEKM